ncbi:MAG: GDSL-type esterase/lipase family protein [Clostridia bacterium]|nr:GDSL-type esterase/lipase family protein [Clostridia bacterium]
MNKGLKRLLGLFLSFIMIVSCMTAMYSQGVFASAPTIYIVGDSTGCHYSETTDSSYYYKRVGFGDKIADYLTGGATVENLALSGRSSKSFTNESNYQTLLNNIGSGDILIIAFGHNDEKVEDASLGTEPLGDKDTEGSFKNSLYTNYIKTAQDKGATPVLCSPIVRLPKGESWTDKDLHKVNGGDYASCARELASELGIDFIDLTALTKAKYDEVGFTEAANFHAHPNETSIDNTHLNNYGAKMTAYLLASAATGVLKSYIVSSPAAPVKETDLVVNPGYTAPPEGDLTGDDLNSSLWTTTSPWYGSAFGVIGGNPNTTNFDISESGDTVHIKAANNKGKISSTSDGLAMYYQPVSANENFQIYADAHINSIDNTSDQVGFGAIMADSIKVDTNDATFNIKNYVAASPLYMAKGAVGGFAKIDSTIKKGPSLSVLPQAGDDVRVSIVKNGRKYTVTYGSSVSTYELTDTQMQGIMYVGLFAARNADITFSNIIYNNEVVEGDIPTEATTEAVTEAATEDMEISSE